MGKTFLWTFVAVLGGIWLYSRWRSAGAKTTTPSGQIIYGDLTVTPAKDGVFYGPFVDPVTGSFLGPGAQPGTSSFPVQPVGG